MKTKRYLALLLALAMMLSLLSACSGGDEGDGKVAGTDDAGKMANVQTEAGTKAENVNAEQVVKLLYSSEISEWNYLEVSSGSSYANWLDTLVEYDYYGMCQPCLAESWTKSEDGLTWTFKIRQGVKWLRYDGSEYGANVVAEDWVTTAKYILNATNAARTADLLFIFEGAEDYYNATSREDGSEDWSKVGIRAIDESTLEFKLTKPLPYFLSMLTYVWGYPTNAQFLEEQGESFGTDNTTLLYCGAFLCKEWEPESYRTYYRNEQYWDKENIHVERLEYKYNSEEATLAPELLLRGEITYADIPTNQLDEWMNDPEKAAKIRPSRPSSYSYFFLFNFWPNFPEQYDRENWKLVVNNEAFRKSIYYGLDRIAGLTCYDPYNPENFLLRTVTPANFVAAGGKDYTELGDLAAINETDQFNLDKAQEYKKQAMEELKAQGAKFPVQVYMPYDSASTGQTQLAQVVQQQLMRDLGDDYLNIIIEGYPDTDYLNTTRRPGNYAFMMSYWGPDYADPETYTDPFAIGQKYNYIYMADGMAEKTTKDDPEGRLGFDGDFWKNSIYDQKVTEATHEVVDLEKRYTDLANVEAWMIDQAFLIPFGTLGGTGYVSSYMNPFESQYAPFGVSEDRYKYQVVMSKPMSSEEYLAGLEVWEKERNDAIAKAQAEGKDY